MPLDKDALESEMQALIESPPADPAACAQAWGDAMKSYASGIVPPSAGAEPGSAAMVATLTPIFATGLPAFAAIEAALLAFATTVGGAMAGFVPTPPAGLVGLVALPETSSAKDAAKAFADSVDAWMKTGKATPTSGGPDVDWS